jgi:ceroid-lipofuscinosis MFS transporter 7
MEKYRSSVLYFGMALNIITKGTMGVFETLLLIITINYYHWSSVETGIWISICGGIGVIVLLNYSLLLKYFHDYQLVPVGLIFMCGSCFAMNNNYFFFQYPENLNAVLFGSLVSMYAIGYPIGHTTLIGLFSRLLKSQEKQGQSLGYFASVGSLARIVFPLLSAMIMDYYDHYNIIFFGLGVLLLVSLLVYWRYERMIAELMLL